MKYTQSKSVYLLLIENLMKYTQSTVIFGLLSAPVYKPHAPFFLKNPNFILI